MWTLDQKQFLAAILNSGAILFLESSYIFFIFFHIKINKIHVKHILTLFFDSDYFYFLFTIVMTVLVACMENPIFFIEILDELRLIIDKKLIKFLESGV
jgi:hypothetical protein